MCMRRILLKTRFDTLIFEWFDFNKRAGEGKGNKYIVKDAFLLTFLLINSSEKFYEEFCYFVLNNPHHVKWPYIKYLYASKLCYQLEV